jgi:hypothetical protein
MDLQEVGWGGMDCIAVAQDRDGWQVIVNVVMISLLRGTGLSALQCFWESVCQNKRYKQSLSKRPLPLHKRHRAAESELNEYSRVAQ